jgi:hypothetical protein
MHKKKCGCTHTRTRSLARALSALARRRPHLQEQQHPIARSLSAMRLGRRETSCARGPRADAALDVVGQAVSAATGARCLSAAPPTHLTESLHHRTDRHIAVTGPSAHREASTKSVVSTGGQGVDRERIGGVHDGRGARGAARARRSGQQLAPFGRPLEGLEMFAFSRLVRLS